MLFSLKNLAKSSSCCYRTKSLGLVSGIDSTSLPFSTASSSVATIPSKDIVVSFKQWFKSGHNLFLHQIFQILKATDDADRFRDSSYDVSFHHRADLALSHLDLRLMGRAYAVWIGDLAKVGRLDQALEFLLSKQSLEGYVPDVCRYNILISELLREARLEEVCDLILEMKEREVSPDMVTMNVVLCFFCKVGLLDIAVELYNSRFEFGLTPNSMAYNYLINTFCGNGSVDLAYKMLECSLDQGYFPGRKTFSILADALCREGKLDKMKQLALFALEWNLMPSGSTYDKFIATLCRTNRVDDAYLIYEQLIRISEASLVCGESTYVSLINSFCKLNKGEIAARLLIEMQQHGHLPNHKVFRDKGTTRIYNYFIYGAGHARRPDLAGKVLQMMQQSGIVPNLRTHVLMLHSYLKKEKYSDALNYFNDLRQRRNLGRRLYSLMIMGMSKARKPDFALALLEEMREKGNVPSNNCYEVLRYGSEKEQDVLSCLKFFDWVGRQRSFRHTRATFNAIFKILSRATSTRFSTRENPPPSPPSLAPPLSAATSTHPAAAQSPKPASTKSPTATAPSPSTTSPPKPSPSAGSFTF
ncbi:hypothetical protein ACLB2K_028763 [Fragaria x ananassa]